MCIGAGVGVVMSRGIGRNWKGDLVEKAFRD